MKSANLYQYIESHHFGFWHKYVANVNMTYIDCSYKFSPYQHITDDPLPKYPDSFYLKTQFENVTINFTRLFINNVYNNN